VTGAESKTPRSSPFDSWWLPALFGIVSAVFAVASIAGSGHGAASAAVTIEIRGENGAPVLGAVLVAGGESRLADAAGIIRVAGLRGLLAGVVGAPGFLDEPLVLDAASHGSTVRVRLWEARGGSRISYNAAGDVMLGRRYLRPRDDTDPLITADRVGEDARAVVGAVAPLFAAATVSSVNLETVVGADRPSARYPGKRFVIVTPPAALAALEDLGVDIALGANNHVRDQLDGGVERTRTAVEGAGIVYAGAGRTRAAAAAPARVRAGTSAFTVLAFSTVDGVPVNDAYLGGATAGSPAWLGKSRTWGYRERGAEVVSSAPRSIGRVWRVFRAVEARDPALAARMWPSLWSVYPELQDWNAERGHGGANPWDEIASPAAIRRAAAQGGPVVVQFQSGFQYTPWKAGNIARLARAAIDAGADIVIAHHPHVLQGFEWYRGRLIAYSLGNFVFDQDLLATYAGGFLHTVWEEGTLLEARFVPTVLNGYRPQPVAGVTAHRLLRELAERSESPVTIALRSDAQLRYVADPDRLAGAPTFRIDRNTLVIGRPDRHAPWSRTVSLQPGHVRRLSPDALHRVAPDAAGASIMLGVNRFPYGTFDDAASDGRGALFWELGTRARVTDLGRDGDQALQLRLLPGRTTLVRTAGRIPLFDPLVTAADGGTAWPRGAFELRLRLQTASAQSLSVRLDFYRLDDSDPTIDPVSEKLGSRSFVIADGTGSDWRDVRLRFRPPARATHVLPYVLGTSRQPGDAMIDDVELILWRAATGPVAPFVAADYVENRGRRPLSVTLERRALEGRGLPATER